MTGSERVSVRFPMALEGVYDYRVAEGRPVIEGQYVTVPFGPRNLRAVVWGPGTGEVAENKLKDIEAVSDLPPLSAVNREFIERCASYNMASLGSVLRMTLRVPAALDPPKPKVGYRPTGSEPARMTDARARVLDHLKSHAPQTTPEIAKATGVSAAVVKGLVTQGALEPVPIEVSLEIEPPDPGLKGPELSPAQASAASKIVASLGGYEATLLEGVTGSGKTEVYFEAVAAALERGEQVLVLLPEIALTGQWFERFRHRFGASPVTWHSDIGERQRRLSWRAVATGDARVVVGARSALFLPWHNLGLIIVDEEHDPSFKQDEGTTYHARDMAVLRASLGNIPIVLASATPSLETLYNVSEGRYARVHLPVRHGGAALPEIHAIDLRADPPPRGQWLAPTLRDAMVETFAKGEQALLFLNRRGYAPLTLCHKCGYRWQCPHCTAWLVEHRQLNRIECHHCGYYTEKPKTCVECGGEDTLAACGPGVERVAEEVTALFPDARTAVMTSDTIWGPGVAASLFDKMANHEIDLLIGTQIIAKGHHFPLLTLVGVVDADLGLSGGDLRASERIYHLLTQVSGRAGRAERPGRAFLQTHSPDHPVMEALVANDAEAFLRLELDSRIRAGMPPAGRLVALILSGPHMGQVDDLGRELARTAPNIQGVTILGPSNPPLELLRGRHRRRLLLKAPRDVNVQAIVRDWVSPLKIPRHIRLKIDVDPYSFM